MPAAGYLPPVVAQILAETGKFTAAMGTAKAEMTGLQAATTKLAAVGKVAMAGLAIGTLAVGYEATKLAANFDQAMELVHTQAGASQAEVESLKDSVLKLAPAVGIGPAKLAEGLYHIESTGFRGKAAMDILAASARLAAMGMADLDTVTYAMSGVMSVAMKDVKDAADATNYLNTIVGMGDMRMGQLAAAIGTGVLPSFKSAGLGMMDFGAALATIADNSTPADEAATRLRMTVALMSAPTHKAAEALAEIGMKATDMANDMRQPNGLLRAVMDLKTHLENSGKTAVEQNQIIEHAFGGGRTSGAILTLLLESDRLASKYKQLGDEGTRAKVAQEAWAAQQKQFAQQLHQLGAWAQALGVAIGNWLIPKLQATAQWMSRNTETVKILAAIIGGVLVVAIGAWTVAMVQAAIANVAATWEILLIIAAVAALAYGIYELVKHWSTVWNWIKRIGVDIWHGLVDSWHWLLGELRAGALWVHDHVVAPLVRFFTAYLLPGISFALRVLMVGWQFAWGFLSVVITGFRRIWDTVWAGVVATANWAWAHVIRPVLWLVAVAVGALLWTVGKLRQGWDLAWHGIVAAAKLAWEHALRPTLDFVIRYGVNPVKDAIAALRVGWGIAWDAIGAATRSVYDHTLKPIFDLVGKGIGGIKNLLGDIAHNPGKAGADLAHLVPGFASGGTVPGPVGVPRLVLAHGGEEILSNDQVAAMGRRPSGTRAGAGGGEGDINVHLTVVDKDGRTVRTQLLRYARRSGLRPIDLFPATARAL